MARTATHRFVFLALHVAYADGVLQPEEREALSAAAHRLGLSVGIPEQGVLRMVREATDWYHEARDEGRVDADVAECVASLAIFKQDIKASLLWELRALAKAAGGVDREEHILLSDLRAAWKVETVSQ